jgi:3'-phosphoadenosine 5'-phosphosulfate sulfotransferase (PAPS reductase)/FAD synthetase
MDQRTVVWFSAGAASAVAAKLIIAEKPANLVLAYTDPGAEHPDNKRFMAECEQWFGYPVTYLKSEKYVDTWDVWEKERFLVSPQGARCTTELKKKIRRKFQLHDDIQVFGYTSEEEHRADRFREQNPEVNLRTPLIEHGLTKQDCLAMVDRAGIELPAMYKLGYQNNNCIGCPKGGMGYWNKIRVDFPEVFNRMALLERKLDNTVLRSNGKPLFLDELDPKRGHHAKEPSFECSLLCAVAEEIIEDNGY